MKLRGNRPPHLDLWLRSHYLWGQPASYSLKGALLKPNNPLLSLTSTIRHIRIAMAKCQNITFFAICFCDVERLINRHCL
jgi:hypothetical protein